MAKTTKPRPLPKPVKRLMWAAIKDGRITPFLIFSKRKLADPWGNQSAVPVLVTITPLRAKRTARGGKT